LRDRLFPLCVVSGHQMSYLKRVGSYRKTANPDVEIAMMFFVLLHLVAENIKLITF